MHAGAKQWLQFMCRAALAAFSESAKISARAKSSPRTADDDHADRLIRGKTAKRVIDGHCKFVVQGIQAIGTAHHQHSDAVVLRFQKNGTGLRRMRRIAHWSPG